MQISIELDQEELDQEEPNFAVQISGGEYWDGDFEIDDYQLSINDLRINNIPAKFLKEIVLEAANHLIVNGHDFQIVKDDHQDQRYKLIEKS